MSKILFIVADEGATPAEWDRVERIVATFGGQTVNVVSQPSTPPVSVVTSTPTPSGSQPADRMAKARAAKAAKAAARKASEGSPTPASTPSGSFTDRMAVLAGKAPQASVQTPSGSSTPDLSSFHIADCSEAQAQAVLSFAENTPVADKKTALVLFLEGKRSLGDLASVPSGKGGASNLAVETWGKIKRAKANA